MRYEEGFTQLFQGFNAFYRCFVAEPQKGVVVGVHGFCEHSGRYAEFGRFLAENGYTFCMHDLRGHGRSIKGEDRGFVEKFELFVKDVESFIDLVSRKFSADSVHLLGHSMGGLIAVYYAGAVGKGIRSLITSGAAVYIPQPPLMQRFLVGLLSIVSPRKRIQLPINPKELSTDEAVAKAYAEDPLVVKDPTVRLVYELYKASKAVWRYVNRIQVPALILHGREDRIVPVEASERLYRTISSKDKKLVIYDGMKHEILNERNKEVVYREVLDWLNTH